MTCAVMPPLVACLVVRFKKGDRKIDVMRPLLAKAAATGRSQVVAVGVAQEFQRVFTGVQCEGDGGVPRFAFGKAERRTTRFYFYLWDAEFGSAFIEICTYFPVSGQGLGEWP
jgi:hypothetical protein